MNYASAGPLVDPVVLVPFVDPATTGPISRSSHSRAGPITTSRCSHSLSHQWIQLQLVPLVNPAAAVPSVDAYASPIKL